MNEALPLKKEKESIVCGPWVLEESVFQRQSLHYSKHHLPLFRSQGIGFLK